MSFTVYSITRTVYWTDFIKVILFCGICRGLDTVRKKGKSSTLDLPIDSVSLSLQDLIGYFKPPEDHLDHEDKQNRLRALKNRQNLFQEEVGSSSRCVCVCVCITEFLTPSKVTPNKPLFGSYQFSLGDFGLTNLTI